MSQSAEIYARDILGNPVKVTPGQAEDMATSGRQVIGQPEAQEAANAQQNLSYVDQNWGGLGKFGMGAFSGLTAGLGPDIASYMGLIDPGHLRAAQTSGLYTAGDIAGMALPALVGDEAGLLGKGLSYTPAGLIGKAGGMASSATERVLGGVLGEAPGLLGRLASQPIQMAARGATEGALIGLGHQVGENILDNKPLAAEALAALQGGALYGGLLGGGAGLVSGIGDLAINAAKGVLKSGMANRGMESIVARRMGLNAGDVEGLSSAEGGLKAGLKSYGEVLEEGGAKLSDSTVKLEKAAKNSSELYTKARTEVLDAMDKNPGVSIPSDRIVGRLNTEILSPIKDTPDFAPAANEVAKTAEFISRPNLTWTKAAQIRDQLAALDGPVSKQITNIIDSELRSSMETVDSVLADKYGSATTKLAIAQKLEEALGKKASAAVMAHEPTFSPRDMASAAISASFGHPYVGATLLAAKGVGKLLPARLEPAMAQYAYDSMVGNKAMAATSEVKARIGKSLGKLFQSGQKAGSIAAGESAVKRPTADRAEYEKQASQAEALLSANHQARVAQYANMVAQAGYQQLAASILDNNQKAVNFLQYNAVPRKGTKAMTSLRGYAAPIGLDEGEGKASRHMFAVNNPMDVVDRIGDGQVSRDEMDALKYVNPAIHGEIVTQATQKVYEAKLSGHPLPMEKIVALGVALDAPVDSSLESSFINPVQASYASAKQGPTGPAGPAPSQNQPMSGIAKGLMTPAEANAYA